MNNPPVLFNKRDPNQYSRMSGSDLPAKNYNKNLSLSMQGSDYS